MEDIRKADPTAEEKANLKVEKTKDDHSKIKGSSQVDIRRYDCGKSHGRTTDSIGPGHEPGTTPGMGA